jgi:hypothetical protein
VLFALSLLKGVGALPLRLPLAFIWMGCSASCNCACCCPPACCACCCALSRATPAPSQIQTSPKKPPLNFSYSQIVKTNLNPQARDPGKYQVTKSSDLPRDPSTPQIPHDQLTHDHGKPLGDLPRNWSPTRLQDCVNFRNAMCLLINMWKTMGRINKDNTIHKVTRLTAAQSAAVKLSRFDHPCTNNLPALKGSLPVTHIRACPKAVHRPPCISI